MAQHWTLRNANSSQLNINSVVKTSTLNYHNKHSAYQFTLIHCYQSYDPYKKSILVFE